MTGTENNQSGDLATCLSTLDRGDLASLLELAGIQVYDSEDYATLLEAVRVNVKDGTIARGDVEYLLDC